MKKQTFLKRASTFMIAAAILTTLASFTTGSNQSYASADLKQAKTEPTDKTATIEQIEQQAFDLVNVYRKSLNKPTFERNAVIDVQARNHSHDMAYQKVPFGHDGALDRLNTVAKTLKVMEGGAENVFECSNTFSNLAQEAFTAWLHSEHHRTNMQGDYNMAGMGVAIAPNGDYYFTQIFVKGH